MAKALAEKNGLVLSSFPYVLQVENHKKMKRICIRVFSHEFKGFTKSLNEILFPDVLSNEILRHSKGTHF